MGAAAGSLPRYPAAFTMARAVGVKMATTTALGSTMENSTDARNHTVIWLFMLGPMKARHRRAIRWSRPIGSQGRVSRVAAKSSTMLLEAYWASTRSMGARERNALATTGSRAVTVSPTGRVIHQKIIHSDTPMAQAPDAPNPSASSHRHSSISPGPSQRQIRFFIPVTPFG